MGHELVQRRRQRWVIALFFFLAGLLTASWSSRIPEIQHKLRLDNAALGMVLFGIPLGLVIGLLLAGRLVAHHGAKRMMLMAAITGSVVLVSTTLATTAWQLMIALFFMGMTRTLFNLSINTGAIELQKQYTRPILSSFHGVWSLACFVAAAFGTLMIVQNVRPSLHFPLVSLVVLITALAFIGRREKTTQVLERRPFFVKPDPYLFLLGLIALCAMLCEGAMFDWGVNYFEKVVKADKGLVTTGYTSFILAMAIGRLIGDRFIAALGVHRMLRINATMMAIGFSVAALFPFLLPAAAGFLLIGLGDSILVPMIYLLASRSEKMPASYALQAVTLIGYAGFLIGPLFIGNVSQHWGMASAFFCLSGLCLLIIVLSVRVKRLSNATATDD